MSDISHDSERDAIHKAVGLALDAWSRVEMALDEFFANVLRHDLMTASIIMASIISFKARIQVCNNLMSNVRLTPELEARWTNIHSRLSKKYDRRNELAHFTIVGVPRDDTSEVELLLVPYYSTGNFGLRFHRRGGDVMRFFRESGLTPAKIEARAEAFATLADELNQLARDLMDYLRQPRTARAQANGPAPAPDSPSDPSPTET